MVAEAIGVILALYMLGFAPGMGVMWLLFKSKRLRLSGKNVGEYSLVFWVFGLLVEYVCLDLWKMDMPCVAQILLIVISPVVAFVWALSCERMRRNREM